MGTCATMKYRIYLAAIVLLIMSITSSVCTFAVEQPSPDRAVIDRIAAVVGEEIILLSEVRQKVQVLMMARKMNRQPNQAELQELFREALTDMVNEQLLLVKAQEDSIEVDLRRVDDLEKQRIAELKNNFDAEEAFVQALKQAGLTEQQYRYSVRESSYKYVLTEMLMDQIAAGISVTSQDMESWVAANQDSLPMMPEQYKLSHILLYPRVSEERQNAAKEKLEGIRERITAGEDFGELAKEYSEDPGSGKDGGDLGYFTRNKMVQEFADVAFSLETGDVSEIFETQFGYHILKVEDIRGDEVRARHILILLQEGEEDAKVIIGRLNDIREKIVSGEATFDEMAKQHSEDETSKELGGRLQWLTADSGLNSFIAPAKGMKPGDISDPIKSEFGYHLLKLDDYRPEHRINVKDDNHLIRQMVLQQKNMNELDRILDKIRNETFIDVRFN